MIIKSPSVKINRDNTSRSLLYLVNRISADDTQHLVHIPNLLRKLTARGWLVQLVSERGGAGSAKIDGLPVTYLSQEGRWSRLPGLIRVLVSARRKGNRLVFVRISKSSALISGILGRFFGWKTLYWVSGTVQDFNIRKRRWRGRLENISLGVVLHIVDYLATGPETMKNYYSNYFNLPQEKILVLYNDIECSSLETNRLHNAQPAGTEDRVLMVHRLSPVRETMRWFPKIIDALSARQARGQKVVLEVIGTGPELPELQRAAHQNRSFVHFRGAVPNRHLDEYYRRADLFLMPSAREGFPRVCLEAMAQGIPVVATDAGGTRDIFGPLQQEFVVSVDEPAQFVRKMEELLDYPDRRRALAEENLQYVQRFSTDAVATMYDERLSALLGR